jgi:hypothetical protein
MFLTPQCEIADEYTTDVPAIIVDTEVSTPPETPPGIASRRGSVGVFPDLPSTSRTSLGASYVFRDESLSADAAAGSALQRSRRSSDVSILSADLGYRLSYVPLNFNGARVSLPRISREMTPVEQDAQCVLSSMENSVWGGECPDSRYGYFCSIIFRHDASSSRRRNMRIPSS